MTMTTMTIATSNTLPLGTKAPDFLLPDTISGEFLSLEDIIENQQGLLVMFLCNHCPSVHHVMDELVKLGKDYAKRPIGIAAISSNDVYTFPQDAPEEMNKMAREYGVTFPYLYDESQETAKAYGATCTPDFYLFDGDLKLVYHGQLDDSRPGIEAPLNGRDLRAAMEAVLGEGEIPAVQHASAGCSIKWREPAF